MSITSYTSATGPKGQRIKSGRAFGFGERLNRSRQSLADAAKDDLAGNGGADWYLADTADLIASGGGDKVTRF